MTPKLNLLGYDTFTFFYRAASPFSNWHPAPFTFRDVRFATSEQFMMLCKAMLFEDAEAAAKIMGSADPRANKADGRAVCGFNQAVWKPLARPLVYTGCCAKFKQNPKLLEQLYTTQGTLLVEASPTDQLWGIGLAASDERTLSPASWRGANWLGEVLTRLRDDLVVGVPTSTPALLEDWFKIKTIPIP